MAATEPGKIRNVAVVGHRGTGKTSLVEAMLFQSDAVNRLGTVEAGTTVSDWEDEEHKRQMTLAASVCHADWQGRKINLLDTPGDAGFQGDAIAALTVADGALVVVSAVMGVEVGHRTGLEACGCRRPRARPVREHARPRAGRLLPGAGPDPGAVRRLVHRRRAPDRRRARAGGRRRPAAHEGLPEPGGREGGRARRTIPADLADTSPEYREKLLDAVVETDEGADGALPRGRGARRRGGRGRAQERRHARRRSSRSPAASRRRTSARRRCSTCSSRACPRRPSAARRSTSATRPRRPSSSRRSPTRSPAGSMSSACSRAALKGDSTVANGRAHAKERLGQLLTLQGKEHVATPEFAAGDIGAVAKLKETQTGDLLLDSDRASRRRRSSSRPR